MATTGAVDGRRETVLSCGHARCGLEKPPPQSACREKEIGRQQQRECQRATGSQQRERGGREGTFTRAELRREDERGEQGRSIYDIRYTIYAPLVFQIGRASCRER